MESYYIMNKKLLSYQTLELGVFGLQRLQSSGISSRPVDYGMNYRRPQQIWLCLP